MAREPVPSRETILCDTSFVSATQSGRALPTQWQTGVAARLNQAILAISVITLAELRDGYIYAGWGEARRQRAEQLISGYLLIPMDMAIVIVLRKPAPRAGPAESPCQITTSGSRLRPTRAGGHSSPVTVISTHPRLRSHQAPRQGVAALNGCACVCSCLVVRADPGGQRFDGLPCSLVADAQGARNRLVAHAELAQLSRLVADLQIHGC